MRVAITGATGMVGSALADLLSKEGHEIIRVGRKNTGKANDVLWDPERGSIDAAKLEGLDAVVHLAGENIAAGRWTPARKERIRQSRVKGTNLLAETLSKLQKPPKVLVSASAIGFYGDRAAATLSEESGPGSGFLSDVCRAWEQATEPAVTKGIRVTCLRVGIVLSTRGGALAKMLTPFKMGVGGNVGPGSQYMSWISLRDLCQVISYAVQTEGLRGPVNAVSPTPVTNAAFTKALGAAVHRPTMFPLPAFAARLAFGEMADALLLASTRVVPARLQSSGFSFKDSDLGETLREIVNTNA